MRGAHSNETAIAACSTCVGTASRRDSRPRLSSGAKAPPLNCPATKRTRTALAWTAEGGCPYTSLEVHRDAGRKPHAILTLAIKASVDPIELSAERYWPDDSIVQSSANTIGERSIR